MSQTTVKYLAKVTERMTGVGELCAELSGHATPQQARTALLRHAERNLQYAPPAHLTGSPGEIVERLRGMSDDGTVDAGKFVYSILQES